MTPRDRTDQGERSERAGGPGEADRGVTSTVGYVLTVAIAVLLVSGVVLGVGQTVESQRDEVIRDEATVVAERTAAALMAADRLVQAGTEPTTTVRRSPPERLAGKPYTVTLQDDAGERASVIIRTRGSDVTVAVDLLVRTPIAETTITGGEFRLVYDPSAGEMTLEGGVP